MVVMDDVEQEVGTAVEESTKEVTVGDSTEGAGAG